MEEQPRRSGGAQSPRRAGRAACAPGQMPAVPRLHGINTPLLLRRFFQRCPLPEETRNARDCCVGSWMESLAFGTWLAALLPRAHLPPGAAAGAPVPAKAPDSCSSLLISVHGHLFRRAGGCLDKLKAKECIQHYGISCFSKGYCPGTTANSGRGLCTFPIKQL